MKDDDNQSPAAAGDDDKAHAELWAEFEAEEAKTADKPDDSEFVAVTDEPEEKGEPEEPQEPEEGEGADDQDGDDPKDGDADDSELDIKALKEQNARLEQKWRSEQNRAKGQQRAAEAAARERDELLKQIQARQEKTSDDEDSDLADLEEEYGEIVGPLKKRIEALTSRLDQFGDRDADRVKALEGELDSLHEAAWADLTAEHPDGLDVITENREIFREWIEDQPKVYRDIFEGNKELVVDGTGVSLLVSRFKQALRNAEESGSDEAGSEGDRSETRPRNSKRELQKEGAHSTRSRGRQATTSAPSPDSDDHQGHWKYWERMEKRS